MAGEFAQTFMKTLQAAEASGEVQPLVKLFAADATLSNLAMDEPLQGSEAIEKFWQNYLSVFGQIQSQFIRVTEGNETIVLEWVSSGTLSQGDPLSYRGVSILDVRDERVQQFRTYYDSAVFLPNGAKQAASR